MEKSVINNSQKWDTPFKHPNCGVIVQHIVAEGTIYRCNKCGSLAEDLFDLLYDYPPKQDEQAQWMANRYRNGYRKFT